MKTFYKYAFLSLLTLLGACSPNVWTQHGWNETTPVQPDQIDVLKQDKAFLVMTSRCTKEYCGDILFEWVNKESSELKKYCGTDIRNMHGYVDAKEAIYFNHVDALWETNTTWTEDGKPISKLHVVPVTPGTYVERGVSVLVAWHHFKPSRQVTLEAGDVVYVGDFTIDGPPFRIDWKDDDMDYLKTRMSDEGYGSLNKNLRTVGDTRLKICG